MAGLIAVVCLYPLLEDFDFQVKMFDKVQDVKQSYIKRHPQQLSGKIIHVSNISSDLNYKLRNYQAVCVTLWHIL